VPVAALWLFWRERKALAALDPKPCWWGIGLIVLAQVAVGYGLIFMFESAERYSLVVMAVALVLLVGGRQVFWRLKWILLLLFLMVPLPGRIHNLISDPLQSLSTQGAVMALELLGVTTLREGHVLLLNGKTSVAVAEACSGLRMLTAFVVVAYVFACVVNRPSWQKLAVALSSIPIAIFCNLIRLVVTSLLFLGTSNETAESFFHDFAGVTMMPLAFLAMVGELWIMARLVTPDETANPTTNPGKK
jgi:exosortase